MKREAPSIWRKRDFVLLMSGTTVNSIGDWLLELALPLYVFIETDSGIATAAVYFVRLAVGVFFGPLGGSLADRWNLRRTLVITNVLQVLALGPLLVVTPDRIWPVFIVVALQALIGSVNDPAGFALVPRLVDEDQLVSANSALSAGGSIARLIGAAAGGIAVGVGGITTVAVLDGATFLVGAITAWLMASRYSPIEQHESEDEVDSSIRAGVRVVRNQPVVAALIWVQTLASFVFGGFPVLFIVFVTEYLDGGGTEVGLIRAMSALGGLVAAAVVGRFAAGRHPAAVMTGGYLLFGAVSALFINAPPITTSLWVYLVLFGMTGFPNVASQVGQYSTAQLLCPPAVMGRLGGLMSASGALGMGLGAVAAGLLLESLTARTLLNGQAATFVLCGLVGLVFVVRPLYRSGELTIAKPKQEQTA